MKFGRTGKVMSTEKIGKFEYLGFYNLKYKANKFFSKDNEIDMTKYYLIVVEAGYLQIVVDDLEDITSFLSKQNWYIYESDRIFVFQLFSEKQMRIREIEEGNAEVIDDIFYDANGIHPLDFDEKTKQIIEILSEFWF